VSETAVTYGVTLDTDLTVQQYIEQENYLNVIDDILTNLAISRQSDHTLAGLSPGSVIINGQIGTTA